MKYLLREIIGKELVRGKELVQGEEVKNNGEDHT
jgi:hypothetical protein